LTGGYDYVKFLSYATQNLFGGALGAGAVFEAV
jgi:hypothetical protein